MTSDAELKAELERLRTENEALRKRATSANIRVSAKGAVSIYGLGRFPVTLYMGQWIRLLDMANDIRAFILVHEGELKQKE